MPAKFRQGSGKKWMQPTIYFGQESRCLRFDTKSLQGFPLLVCNLLSSGKGNRRRGWDKNTGGLSALVFFFCC